jgi:Putative phage tail protein
LSTVERWLAEARVARDSIRFGLAKSQLAIGAGDVVSFRDALYRIDRAEQAEAQLLDGVRIEAGVYTTAQLDSEAIVTRAFLPPVPVLPYFLDLPLLTGEEVPHAPHIAVTAEPWLGAAAVWSAAQDAGYELNRLIAVPAVIGITETAMSSASPGVWDRGPALRVKIVGGELASADPVSVLNGANAMAIGDGSAANWEVFQFATAEIVAPDTYDLSLRLRGQAGSDGVMPASWPIGSTVVLLDLGLVQLDLPLAARGLDRYYRIGTASRGVDDLNTVLRVEAFAGIGLRPYPVAHLRAASVAPADHLLSWKRRTRIDGDSWIAPEVPLGEETESYLIRIRQGSVVRAEYSVALTQFLYTDAMRMADQVVGAFTVEVAQVSQTFGAGPFRGIGLP